MDFKVVGDSMPCVVCQLNVGEEVQAEAGSLMYMTHGIDLNTQMTGGLFAGVKRMLSGATLFLMHFKCQAPTGQLAFTSHYPGHVRELHLNGDSWLCVQESFLFSTTGVEIQSAFTQRFGFGIFSGTGFILQRLAGHGVAYIHGGGNLMDIDLQPGQRLSVEAGSIVAFQESVQYNIQLVGGLKNTLFGGDGIYLCSFVGPGRVTISTLPFAKLAGAILAKAKDLQNGNSNNNNLNF